LEIIAHRPGDRLVGNDALNLRRSAKPGEVLLAKFAACAIGIGSP
jgi:hypothetical protein